MQILRVSLEILFAGDMEPRMHLLNTWKNVIISQVNLELVKLACSETTTRHYLASAGMFKIFCNIPTDFSFRQLLRNGYLAVIIIILMETLLSINFSGEIRQTCDTQPKMS